MKYWYIADYYEDGECIRVADYFENNTNILTHVRTLGKVSVIQLMPTMKEAKEQAELHNKMAREHGHLMSWEKYFELSTNRKEN